MQPTEPTKPIIVATIPCYNEEHYIADVVHRTKKYVDQVIVIDDGSQDNTLKVAQDAGACVIRSESNIGAGAATKSCFKAAKTHSADILVTLDGDNQHFPEEIPNLLAPILSDDADLVIGTRFRGGVSNIPRYRKLGISLITWLINIGSDVKISDAQSCFRAHNARLLENVNITDSGFGFSVQIIIEARRKGYRIMEVPISCLYHPESSTMNPISHGLRVVLAVIKYRINPSGLTNKISYFISMFRGRKKGEGSKS